MNADDIHIWTDQAIGRVHLNAPKRLNALSLTMIRGLHQALHLWRLDAAVKAVVITGEGDRAFCAGGDIRFLREARMSEGAAAAAAFYAEEYQLNWAVHEFPKPYIALMDGITMGGGCGVSINGDVRIATEQTSLAMPETGIGLFPDVGATKFLSALKGRTGLFLGLTGQRIDAADCCHYGIATHYMPRSRQADFLEALSAISPEHDFARNLAKCLSDFCEKAPGALPFGRQQSTIDALFAGEDVTEIRARLAGHAEPEWQALAETLDEKCPASLKITASQLRRGPSLSFDDAIRLEYRLASRLMAQNNFFEGVRAILIDRDRNPQWVPPTLEDVTSSYIDEMFSPLPEGDLALSWSA